MSRVDTWRPRKRKRIQAIPGHGGSISCLIHALPFTERGFRILHFSFCTERPLLILTLPARHKKYCFHTYQQNALHSPSRTHQCNRFATWPSHLLPYIHPQDLKDGPFISPFQISPRPSPPLFYTALPHRISSATTIPSGIDGTSHSNLRTTHAQALPSKLVHYNPPRKIRALEPLMQRDESRL